MYAVLCTLTLSWKNDWYIDGVKYDNSYNPLGFSDQLVYMKQSIREDIPVSKTTIRQIFYDEVDDKKISKVTIQGRNVEGVEMDGTTFSTYITDYPNLVDYLRI